MPDLEPALFGLIGTVLGAIISPLTVIGLKAFDVWRATSKSKEYLAIRVSSRLRNFAAECVQVSHDCGSPDGGGFWTADVKLPVFDPEVPDVDWKSLPTKMSYPILDFPDRVTEAAQLVGAVEENATPPDYSEWYEERQYHYSVLGLRAIELADLLHAEAKLPERPPGRWDMKEYLVANIAHKEKARAEQERRNLEWTQALIKNAEDEKKPDQAQA